MQLVAPDVATVATGLAASMGQFLLTAGAPGKRAVLPHAEVMMHQPHGGAGGTASDIVIRAGMLGRLKRRIAEVTAERSGGRSRRSRSTPTATAGSPRPRRSPTAWPTAC
jgi:ATP-dependent Clp protease protease subunit